MSQYLETETISPGAYWVVCSHRGDFSDRDNIVSTTLVWVSRISAVNTTDYQSQLPQHTGYVVDVESGKPIHGAEVTAWQRDQRSRPRKMVKQETTETNQDGQYTLKAYSGQETVFVVSSTIDGQIHHVLTEPETIVAPRKYTTFQTVDRADDRSRNLSTKPTAPFQRCSD